MHAELSYFVSDFVAMATGSVVVERFCHHLIARPQLGAGILWCCTNWVTVYFVSHFVVMVTGVGCCKIYLTSFNSPTLKTPDRRKNLGDILYTQSDYRFCVNFRCYGNIGYPGVNLNYALK